MKKALVKSALMSDSPAGQIDQFSIPQETGMDNLIYHDVADRIIAAQQAYRQIYVQTNPPPVIPQKRSRRDVFGRLALWAVMLAAVIVSGSHTVAVFSIGKSGVVGVAAFVMLEIGLFIFSFFYTRDTYRSREDAHVLGYLKRGMQVTFFVLIAGNLSDVLRNNGFASGELWIAVDFIVSASVALSAPILAWIVGHTLAMLMVQDMALDRRANDDYAKLLKEWNDAFIQAWNANKARWGATVTVEFPKVSSGIPMENSMENNALLPSKSSIGHTKAPDASKKANDYFDTNPQALDGNAIEIAKELGIGKSTVYAIMKERKQGAVERNGKDA